MRTTLPNWRHSWLFILIAIGLPFLLQAQTHSVIAPITNETINDPSFENPGANAWTFLGTAGTVDDNIAALNGNPDTPFGSRLMYIRGNGSGGQLLNVSADGCFRFKIWAAQYANNSVNQSFQILVDGLEVGEFTPADINYSEQVSVAFTMTQGSHILEIRGTPAGSQVVLLDNVQLEKLPCWSDNTVWSAGTPPLPTSTIQVDADKVIVLDIDAVVLDLTINGQFLAANNRPLKFGAERVLLMGGAALWEWGQEQTPYVWRGVITLRGDVSQQNINPNMGSGFIGAMMGARLRMHGSPKDSWTQLDKTAKPGASGITLKEEMNWEKGDTIVIASTDFDCHQAEKRVIASITGQDITFQVPLLYEHYGNFQSYDNGNYLLDERAEVGLLNRNLKIQGDADAETDGYGGHVMVMTGSKANLSNVEFYRMGQKALLGRYPFHWHQTGDIDGQYLKDCSIHRSFNRVMTVHSSQNGLIENNVAYDHIGNGYFLENGDETGNSFIHNLGLVTRAAAPGELVQPYDFLPDANASLPFIRLPATYWITHPTNDFIGNACGGSEGSGFWMVTQEKPIEGTNPNGIAPWLAPLGAFRDNRSHSTSFSNFSIDLEIKVDGGGNHYISENTFRNYSPQGGIPVVERFTSFKSRDRAIWMRTETLYFEDCHSADNGRSTFFSFNNHIYNSLYVGKSNNKGTASTWLANETAAGRSLPIPSNDLNAFSVENHFRGHPLYDGPSEIVDCHFADYYGEDASIFAPNTAFLKSTVHAVEGMTFENVPTGNKFSQLFSKDRDFQWTTGVLDRDGSVDALTNAGDFIKPEIIAPDDAGRRVYEKGFNNEPGAIYESTWEHFICPDEHYALFFMDYSWENSRKTPMYSIRSDGPATYTLGQDYKNMIPVITDNDVRYYLQLHRMPSEMEMKLSFANYADTVTFIMPNMPSNTHVTNASQASSLADFNANLSKQYFFENNTLYFRLKAYNSHNTSVLGNNFKYGSSLRICESTSCQQEQEGGSFGMPLADYERGEDTRASLNIWGDLADSGISFNPSATPFDGVDDANSFVVTTDGDQIDEYVEYRLGFFRQVWSEFNNLKIDYTGSKIQVLLHDASEGDVHIGYYNPESCYGLDLTRLTKDQIDEVDGLIIRVYESFVDDDWQTAGKTTTISLKELYLDYSIELSDFTYDTQNWLPVNTTTVSQSNGFLNLVGNGTTMGARNDLFFGNAPVDPTQTPKAVVRMRSNTSGNSLFGKLLWTGGGWQHTNQSISSSTAFENYIYDIPFNSNDDIQRVRVIPKGGPNTAIVDIDFIRFTTCETCYDEIQNGDEEDVDCGGSECLPCTCKDGILNGDEEEVDCGGSCPNACSELVFEHGILDNVTNSWTVVNTENTYGEMVVIATPVLISGFQIPVVTRVRNVTNTSFEVRIQHPGGNTAQGHTVHYFVVEEGTYTQADDGIDMEAFVVNSSQTAFRNSWTLESRTYQNTYTKPVVLGQVQSYNDSNWSVFWASDASSQLLVPSSGTSFAAGKQVAEDTQTARATEQIGYIVCEEGIYVFGEEILQVAVGPSTIRGVDDVLLSGGDQYTADDDLKIETAVLSSAAMDGNNGGWPVLYSASPLVNNTIKMAIDEDDISDAERKHIPEQVAYLAIGTHSAETGVGLNPSPQIAGGTNKPASMAETRSTPSVKLFPNPAAPGQVIHIQDVEGTLGEGLQVYTLEGQAVIVEEVNYSDYEITLRANLPAGIYFLVYQADGMQMHQRLIVLEASID